MSLLAETSLRLRRPGTREKNASTPVSSWLSSPTATWQRKKKALASQSSVETLNDEDMEDSDSAKTCTAAKNGELPPQCFLSSVSPITMPDLRALNALIFPVRYNDRFYNDLLLTHPPELSRLVYHNSRAIAAICSRLEWDDTAPTPNPVESSIRSTFPAHPQLLSMREYEPLRIYLMTIGTDPSYRRSGLASALLVYLIKQAKEWNRTLLADRTKGNGIVRIVLHVHSVNEESIDWYLRRGFQKVAFEEGYYSQNKGVRPPDAWMLAFDLSDQANNGDDF